MAEETTKVAAFPRKSSLKGREDSSGDEAVNRRLHATRVSWAAGTAPAPEASYAVSIPCWSINKDKKIVYYHIDVSYGGRLLQLKRRYSDFTKLQMGLMSEFEESDNLLAMNAFPVLPSKRWFNFQKWFGRFDETFTEQRRLKLQEYLRTICKLENTLPDSSVALATFLQTKALHDWEESVRQSSLGSRGSGGDDDSLIALQGPIQDPSISMLVEDLRQIIEDPGSSDASLHGLESDDSVSCEGSSRSRNKENVNAWEDMDDCLGVGIKRIDMNDEVKKAEIGRSIFNTLGPEPMERRTTEPRMNCMLDASEKARFSQGGDGDRDFSSDNGDDKKDNDNGTKEGENYDLEFDDSWMNGVEGGMGEIGSYADDEDVMLRIREEV